MGRRRGLFLACFALLCHLLPGVVAGDKAIGKTNSKLMCAGSSALKGAANKLLDDAAAGLQTVWQMDLATTREETQLARVQMCTGTERRENIVKAVSDRIKQRRGKVALARNASEEAMQEAKEFAKFAYRVAGGIDAFMLTLATYSAGAQGGTHNARCLNNADAGTGAETYQAGGETGGKSEEQVNAMLALIAECRQPKPANRQTIREAKQAIARSEFVTPFDSTKDSNGFAAGTAGTSDGGCALLSGHKRSSSDHALFQTAAGSFPFAVYGGIWTVQSSGTADAGIKLQITEDQDETTRNSTGMTAEGKAIIRKQGTAGAALTMISQVKLLADGFAHGDKASSILETADTPGTLAEIAKRHHALSQGITVGQDTQQHSLTALLEEALADPCTHAQDAEEADTNADTKAEYNDATEQRPRTGATPANNATPQATTQAPSTAWRPWARALALGTALITANTAHIHAA
ncbi:putative Trypanosome variant surface glycoprotein (A type) [Trypanosoma vivax]|nr:putative Trypanosome variant surface glycoprotein (A type) [Trypanosoma vivax]